MKKSFLSYTGRYEEDNTDNFTFYFDDNTTAKMPPIFIIPPVYDVAFKTVFSYDQNGIELVKDFLNSLLFPVSQSITEIKAIASKEILSRNVFKNNKGTKIVDDAFLVKLKGKNKDIIIDIEMEKKFNYDLTEKFYDYGNGLRRTNNFLETWVIALCIDNSKNPFIDKGSNSYVVKKENNNAHITQLSFIKIYEIYLNNLYKNIRNEISIFPNEIIKEEGKEWIKLFTITLWGNPKKDIYYGIPSKLFFKGDRIKDAIEILADMRDLNRLKIETELNFQKKIDEENKKIIEDKYHQGKMEGKKEEKMEILDFFFNKHKKRKNIENIEVLGKISKKLILKKYGNNSESNSFIKELEGRNLIS